MEKKETAEKARYLPTLFPESLLKQIDDYRFENRLPSRAEAIRELIQAGLQPQGRRRKSAAA
jgi:metal-responsive CopG/Arc/MetJ family transcriptional regulator